MSASLEIFQELYNDIRKSESIEEVIEAWSGVLITIPSFIGEIRDKAIYRHYLTLSPDYTQNRKEIILAKKYGITTNTIKRVLKKFKEE